MFGHEATKRELKRRAVRAIPGLAANAAAKSVSQIYAENYSTIVRLLENELTSDMNVFTHNPWGEYGHEDHLQVFRAVDQLQSEIGFKQWMENYVTNRSLPLAKTYFGADLQNPICFRTDVPYAKEFTDIYKNIIVGAGAMIGSGLSRNVLRSLLRNKLLIRSNRILVR